MKLTRVLAMLSLALGINHAAAADWRLEAAGSRLEFVAMFEKTPAPGVFKDFDVRLDFDSEKPGGRMDVRIRVASADMASADINKAIAGAEWFDFTRHQEARFQSTDIKRVASGRYVAHGILNLKGAQQNVDVPFTWSASAQGATMDGEFIVKRTPFGIGSGAWAATTTIGADVAVKFRVRLRKAN